VQDDIGLGTLQNLRQILDHSQAQATAYINHLTDVLSNLARVDVNAAYE
jgi:hypothetical protein